MVRRDPIAQSDGYEFPVDLIICFSHLRWSFVYQRPQHLLSRAARNATILFWEEPVREHGIGTPRLERRYEGGVEVLVPFLAADLAESQTSSAVRSLLDDLLGEYAGKRVLAWYYTPMALAFSGHLQPELCIYDCMDELSAFHGAPREMREFEQVLLQRADLVFTGGRSLFEAKRETHPAMYAFPSSVDAAHFGRARLKEMEEPGDQAPLPHPRIGFFGVIDERMDFDIVAAIADAKPDWQLVMIGPVVKIEPSLLPHRHNIHWLGARAYEELPAYLRGWDIGFMPFALNEATRFISPTKTLEFLAAAIPLVSTPIPDVVDPFGSTGLVEIGKSVGELVARAEELMRGPQGRWLKRVDEFLDGTSWDRTWHQMNRLLIDAVQTQTDPLTGLASPARYSCNEPAEMTASQLDPVTVPMRADFRDMRSSA